MYIKYKFENGGKMALKSSAEVELDPFDFFGLVYEIDYFNKWIPFCQESREVRFLFNYKVKRVSRGCKICRLGFSVGRFFFSREIDCVGFGFNRLVHKGCYMTQIKSVKVKIQILTFFSLLKILKRFMELRCPRVIQLK